jgi:hypothetical protein
MAKRKIQALAQAEPESIEVLSTDNTKVLNILAEKVVRFKALGKQKRWIETEYEKLRKEILTLAKENSIREVDIGEAKPVAISDTQAFEILASQVIPVITARNFPPEEKTQIVDAIFRVGLTEARKYLGQDSLEKGGGKWNTKTFAKIS